MPAYRRPGPYYLLPGRRAVDSHPAPFRNASQLPGVPPGCHWVAPPVESTTAHAARPLPITIRIYQDYPHAHTFVQLFIQPHFASSVALPAPLKKLSMLGSHLRTAGHYIPTRIRRGRLTGFSIEVSSKYSIRASVGWYLASQGVGLRARYRPFGDVLP